MYLKQMITYAVVLGVLITVMSVTVSANGGPGTRTFQGETKQVGNGSATTWVTVDAQGKPTAIGVTLTEDALNGLPTDDTEYMLSFPPQAEATVFNHFALNWMPHGHEPAGIYNVPHFDVHFYMIPIAERDRITATGEDLARVNLAPAAQFIPQGYVAIPGGVPRMGAHWVNQNTPELHGQPFTQTLIYGFYAGRMVFIEPMMTRAYLLTHPNLYQPLSLPAAYQMSGYFPTSYAITYDPATRQYQIALEGLTYRQAATNTTGCGCGG